MSISVGIGTSIGIISTSISNLYWYCIYISIYISIGIIISTTNSVSIYIGVSTSDIVRVISWRQAH